MKTIVRAAKSAKSAQFVIAALLLMMSLSAQSAETELEAIQNSVIKIYTTQAAPDYFTPWRLLTPRQSSGSGSVIAGNRILTNAHLVANASYIQAQKHNDPKRYLARVVFVSHDADLALITVDEEGFFDDLEPLVLGELPEPQREVSVFGYPMGGKSLTLDVPIAMAIVEIGSAAPGTAVEVDFGRERVAGEVVPLPFYKPAKA